MHACSILLFHFAPTAVAKIVDCNVTEQVENEIHGNTPSCFRGPPRRKRCQGEPGTQPTPSNTTSIPLSGNFVKPYLYSSTTFAYLACVRPQSPQQECGGLPGLPFSVPSSFKHMPVPWHCGQQTLQACGHHAAIKRQLIQSAFKKPSRPNVSNTTIKICRLSGFSSKLRCMKLIERPSSSTPNSSERRQRRPPRRCARARNRCRTGSSAARPAWATSASCRSSA